MFRIDLNETLLKTHLGFDSSLARWLESRTTISIAYHRNNRVLQNHPWWFGYGGGGWWCFGRKSKRRGDGFRPPRGGVGEWVKEIVYPKVVGWISIYSQMKIHFSRNFEFTNSKLIPIILKSKIRSIKIGSFDYQFKIGFPPFISQVNLN